MSFEALLAKYPWELVKERIYNTGRKDILRILRGSAKNSIESFAALLSPAADSYLEKLAVQSQALTQKRFGRTVQMYIPVYISNRCKNSCSYCGFSAKNKIKRLSLSLDELEDELKAVSALGFKHVLLVSGEDPKIDVNYLVNALKLAKRYFAQASLEVEPLSKEAYSTLVTAGLHAVYVYQETYNKIAYPTYHPAGPKADFSYRLATPERLGAARIHKIGLGALIGLEDWRTDAFFVALHLHYLEKHFWQSKFCISFPRLRAAEGVELSDNLISDRELVQLICAYRLFNENVELSLSTREAPTLRDNLIKLGITTVSAGSKTEPGGYCSAELPNLEQFSVADERSPALVAEAIKQAGYEVVWKDWDMSYN